MKSMTRDTSVLDISESGYDPSEQADSVELDLDIKDSSPKLSSFSFLVGSPESDDEGSQSLS
ncbi:1327_t:CDS:2 [Entrophospora sp. SA101]|nr:1327_t:CDS:2 [Entrophospora sp. SA101]